VVAADGRLNTLGLAHINRINSFIFFMGGNIWNDVLQQLALPMQQKMLWMAQCNQLSSQF